MVVESSFHCKGNFLEPTGKSNGVQGMGVKSPLEDLKTYMVRTHKEISKWWKRRGLLYKKSKRTKLKICLP